jgi:hypothetical protein
MIYKYYTTEEVVEVHRAASGASGTQEGNFQWHNPEKDCNK